MADRITVTVADEIGNHTTKEFMVEQKFTVKGKDYLALYLPGEEEDIYLFGCQETDDGSLCPTEIEDDAEYDAIADVYEGMMEEA